MSLPTPRILPSHLHAFAPNSNAQQLTTIRLLGTITSIHGDQATLYCSTPTHASESVTLILNRDSHMRLNGLYEVIGKVVNLEGGMGLGVRVLGGVEWMGQGGGGVSGGGSSVPVDMGVYEAVVDATHRFKEIFYEDGNTSGGGQGGGMDGVMY